MISSGTFPYHSSLRLDNQVLQSKDSARNLGVMISASLSPDVQVSQLCKSLAFQLKIIRRIRKYLNTDCTKTLIAALFTSRLDFCNSLLAGAPRYQLDRLKRLQNSAARLVTGTSPFSRITPILVSLHWLPVHARIAFKIASFVHKTIFGNAPQYLKELLTVRVSDHHLRSAEDRLRLAVPRTRTVRYGDRRFSVTGPRVWNDLPYCIREIQDYKRFKGQLKSYLFRKHFV